MEDSARPVLSIRPIASNDAASGLIVPPAPPVCTTDRDTVAINGSTYALAHVRPFSVNIEHFDQAKYRAIKLVVTFSHHCFSQEIKRGDDPTHFIVEDGEPRRFCAERHAWSSDLANLVRYHVNGKAYESRDGNGIWNHFFYAADGRTIPYAIYFRLTQATNIPGVDGVLHVVSAYENSQLLPRHKYQSVRFAMHAGKLIGFKAK